MLRKESWTGTPVDIYTTGIVLFIMMTATYPFDSADQQDPHYALFTNNETNKLFWKSHDSTNKLSNDFKDLINKMLHDDPEERPSLAQIKNSDWYLGQIV